jgi:1-phosphofructokinase family hexose kinase
MAGVITTVTLNPTRDKALSLARLQPGTMHRARLVREDWGGKGVNVSRALLALEIPSRIVGFMGGRTGRAMRDELVGAGFDVHLAEVQGETRTKLIVHDEANDQYTEINELGPTITPDQMAALQGEIAQMAGPGDMWAFCGSLPPGAPADTYAQLIGVVQARGSPAFLDASGPALRAGVGARPYGIKPNGDEASELLQMTLDGDADHQMAARRLQQAGIHVVALSRGARGLVLALGDRLYRAIPPSVAVRSPVGAGDAALAGLLWAIADGCDPAQTAARAVACGTAAAMQEGTKMPERALVEQLLSQVTVTEL